MSLSGKCSHQVASWKLTQKDVSDFHSKYMAAHSWLWNNYLPSLHKKHPTLRLCSVCSTWARELRSILKSSSLSFRSHRNPLDFSFLFLPNSDENFSNRRVSLLNNISKTRELPLHRKITQDVLRTCSNVGGHYEKKKALEYLYSK